MAATGTQTEHKRSTVLFAARSSLYIGAMARTDPVRIIPHAPEGVPYTGSFEVVWPGGRKFFYWDDVPGRRLRSDALTHDEALEQAKALARDQREKL